MASLESILSRETELELEESAVERENKTMPRINHAVSYVALVGEVGSLLLDQTVSVKEILRELKYLFRKSPTRRREGRKYKRKKLTSARRLRYYRYQKRVIA